MDGTAHMGQGEADDIESNGGDDTVTELRMQEDDMGPPALVEVTRAQVLSLTPDTLDLREVSAPNTVRSHSTRSKVVSPGRVNLPTPGRADPPPRRPATASSEAWTTDEFSSDSKPGEVMGARRPPPPPPRRPDAFEAAGGAEVTRAQVPSLTPDTLDLREVSAPNTVRSHSTRSKVASPGRVNLPTPGRADPPPRRPATASSEAWTTDEFSSGSKPGEVMSARRPPPPAPRRLDAFEAAGGAGAGIGVVAWGASWPDAGGRVAPESAVEAAFNKSKLGHRATLSGYDNSRIASDAKDLVPLVVRAQGIARRFVIRKEMARARGDCDLRVKRLDAIFHLHSLGASRRSSCYIIGYLCLLATFLTMVFAGIVPANEYNAAGFLADTVMGNQWSTGNTGWDVRSRADIYGFISGSILGGAFKLNSTGSDTFNFYNTESQLLPITVTVIRGTKVDCRTVYPANPAAGSNFFFVFNQGFCVTNTPSTETVYTDLGKGYSHEADGVVTTWAAWTADHASYIEDDGNNNDATLFRENLICPVLPYATDEALTAGYTMFYPVGCNKNEWLQIFSLFQECQVIDDAVREVVIELSWDTGNEYPYFVLMVITFKISLGGQVDVSTSLTTIILLSQSDNKYRTVVNGCMWVIIVIGCLSLAWTLLELFGGTVYYGTLFLRYWFRDIWNYHGITTHIVLLVTGSLYLGIDSESAAILTPPESETYSKFLAAMQSINNNTQVFRLMLGTSALLLMTRFFAYFRHRGMLSMLTKAIYHVMTPLAHFLLSMAVVFCAFAVTGHAMFGGQVYNHSTFILSLETLLNMTFGDFNYDELKRINHISAFIFFYSFMVTVVLILLNFFIAIVMEGYAAVYSRGDVSVPLWEQALQDAHAIRQNAAGRVLTAEEVVWILRHDPNFTKLSHFTLFHLRRVSPLPLSAECARVLFNLLVESGSDPEDALRVYHNGYRFIVHDDYLSLKRKYSPPLMPRACRHVISVWLLHLTSFIMARVMAFKISRKRRALKRKRRASRKAKIVPINTTATSPGLDGEVLDGGNADGGGNKFMEGSASDEETALKED